MSEVFSFVRLLSQSAKDKQVVWLRAEQLMAQRMRVDWL